MKNLIEVIKQDANQREEARLQRNQSFLQSNHSIPSNVQNQRKNMVFLMKILLDCR